MESHRWREAFSVTRRAGAKARGRHEANQRAAGMVWVRSGDDTSLDMGQLRILGIWI